MSNDIIKHIEMVTQYEAQRRTGKMSRVRNIQYVKDLDSVRDAEADIINADGSKTTIRWARLNIQEVAAPHMNNDYITLEVPARVSLELMYHLLSIKLECSSINKNEFVRLVLAAMYPGQVRVINVVARADSTLFRGLIQVRLVNPKPSK